MKSRLSCMPWYGRLFVLGSVIIPAALLALTLVKKTRQFVQSTRLPPSQFGILIAAGLYYTVALAPTSSYDAHVQQPIDADGTSVFTVQRGVVPVKFTLSLNCTSTCTLPPATITVTRTSGGDDGIG